MTVKKSISSEDSAVFQEAMRGVAPLAHQPSKAPMIRNPPAPKRRAAALPPRAQLPDLSDYYGEPVSPECALAFHQPGISQLQIKALRQGKLSYQAKLDLHGLKPEAAKLRLVQFITHQIDAGHRWVLIIHGKGGRYGETPVLKNLVNHWLRQLSSVLAFRSAHPKHGGAGAMYVLLKT